MIKAGPIEAAILVRRRFLLVVTALGLAVATQVPAFAEKAPTSEVGNAASELQLNETTGGPEQAASDASEDRQFVFEPEPQPQNLTQPAETTSIPSVVGYYEGEDVLFVHTEVSSAYIARQLTRMIGSPTIHVPALAEVPDSALAGVYIFANGVTPEDTPLGPLGFQADIFDSVPGDASYSPLRKVLRVRWVEGAKARLLRSTEEVEAALAADEIIVESPGVVVNMPFVSWPGGGR